jgi:hypothetical protein
MRRAKNLLAVLFILCFPCFGMTTIAQAAPSVSLTATLTPERLGHGTTLGFGFDVATQPGHVPPPLTQLSVLYPANIGIALSGVGIATCTAVTLEIFGPEGCPPDSRMGFGSALAEIPIGPEIIQENGEISVVRAPTENGHFAILVYAKGVRPVDARIVFPGLLLGAPSPFGGLIRMAVPLVPSVPEAPDVAVVHVQTTIGPDHLTYYERVHGKLVAYNPQGILLPNRCPRGGFQFGATFSFLDGSRASAHTAVPCPRPQATRRARGRA